MKIGIFFNNNRGIHVLETLLKKNYLVDVYLSKKNLNYKILKKIKGKFFIIEKLNSKLIDKIKKENYDLLIVAGWPLIFSKKIIKIAKYGTINLHAGKLPQYRGGSPLNWQIIEGKKEIYISIIKMTKKIDAGPIYMSKKIKLKSNEDINDLHNKVNKLYPNMVLKVIQNIKENIKPKKQNLEFKRYLKQRSDKDGEIKWKLMTNIQVFNFVKAITKPYPGAFYFMKYKKLRLLNCKISKIKQKLEPGSILIKSKQKFIGCKKGSIKVIHEKID